MLGGMFLFRRAAPGEPAVLSFHPDATRRHRDVANLTDSGVLRENAVSRHKYMKGWDLIVTVYRKDSGDIV